MATFRRDLHASEDRIISAVGICTQKGCKARTIEKTQEGLDFWAMEHWGRAHRTSNQGRDMDMEALHWVDIGDGRVSRPVGEQKELVLEALQEGPVTVPQIRRMLGVRYISHIMRSLMDRGQAQCVEKGVYALAEPGAPRRELTEGEKRVLVAVEQAGRAVKPQQVGEMVGITDNRANGYLIALVDMGMLEKVSHGKYDIIK